jgi:photosystem II stability/assembly factor-like uncharacterized protein
MLSKHGIFSILIFIGTNVLAQNINWTQFNQPTTNEIFNDMAVLPNGYVIGVTQQNGTIRSIDDGVTWNKIPIDDVWNIFATSKGILFAYSRNSIFRSDDFGDTWKEIDGLWGDTFSESKSGWIFLNNSSAGSFSTDEGITWNSFPLPQVDYIVTDAFTVDTCNNVFVVGSVSGTEFIFRSTDLGTTWAVVDSMTCCEPREMLTTLNGYIFLVYPDGIRRSVNGGIAWTDIPAFFQPYGLAADHSDTLYVWSDDNIYKSSDYGSSWTKLNSKPLLNQCRKISVTNSNKLFITSYQGTIVSENNGFSWNKLSTGFNRVLEVSSLAFSKSGEFYAYLDFGSGVILKSTDQGNTWTSSYKVESYASQLGLFKSLPNGNVFAGLGDIGGGLYLLSGGDTTWNRLVLGPRRSYYAYFHFTSITNDGQNNVYLGDYGEGIFRSKDGGKTWIIEDSKLDINTIVYSLATNKSGHVYAGTAQGIFLSKDEGESWKKLVFGMGNVYKIAINQDDNIFALTENSGMISSKDGGITWQNLFVTDEYFKFYEYSCDLFIDENGNLFVLGYNSYDSRPIYRSVDKGKTWTKICTTGNLGLNHTLSYYKGFLYLGENKGYMRTEMPILSLVFSRDSIEFGIQEINTTTNREMWIKNVTGNEIQIDSVRIEGKHSFYFHSNLTPVFLTAGDSLKVEVTFNPLSNFAVNKGFLKIYSKSLGSGISVPVEGFVKEKIITANSWINFWGDSVYDNGKPVEEGDVFEAYTLSDLLVGTCIVKTAGSYGLMKVYIDDSLTTETVDGIKLNEPVYFRVNCNTNPKAVFIPEHAGVNKINKFDTIKFNFGKPAAILKPLISYVTPGIGNPNTYFLIIGKNFSGGVQIYMDQTFVSSLMVDDDTMNCLIPELPVGTYDIIVFKMNGQSDTLAKGFTITNDPPPAILSVEPNQVVKNESSLITIACQNISSVVAATIGGLAFKIDTIINDSIIGWNSPKLSVGFHDVKIVNSNGLYGLNFNSFQVLPLLAIISPNGGETLVGQKNYDIIYRINKESSGSVFYSIDKGFSWKEITRFSNLPVGDYVFTWQNIPNINSNYCLIKIIDEYNQENFDFSNSVFNICESSNIPNKPTNLIVNNFSTNLVEMMWDDNSTNESSFRIYRKSNDNWVESGNVTSTSYTDNTVSPGSTYYYKVVAANSFGNSEPSNTILVVTGSVPNQPSGLTLKVISNSSVRLKWEDNSDNEDGFRVERRTAATSWTQLYVTSSSSTRYTDNDLTSSEEYFYRLCASNSFGESKFSNTVSVKTGSIPFAPQNLQALPNGINSMVLSWNDMSDNENGFYVYRKEWNSDSFKKIDDISENSNSYTDYNLISGKQYFYMIYAYNSYGSNESNNASGITFSFPNEPSNVKVSLINGTISLVWKDNASNESNFVIQQQINSGNWEYYSTVNANTESSTINSVIVGNTYKFRIKSQNEFGNSLWAISNSLEATDESFTASIVVKDKDGAVSGAEIYIKKTGNTNFEKYLQTTNSYGLCQIQNLKIGDEILVRKEKTELAYASNKNAHEMVNNKVFVVYYDNCSINSNNFSYTKINSRKNSFDIELNHAVIGYNLVVSLNFSNPWEDYAASFTNASKYLYNVLDGQGFLNKVYIYENGKYNKEADVIIENAYDEAAWPNSNNSIFGIYKKDNLIFDYRIQMGRSWYGNPGTSDYDRTIIHEFGHYAFGFYDEYLDGTNIFELNRNIHPSNYGFMDNQYSSTEMSSYNDYRKSYSWPTPMYMVTSQLQNRKLPCWQWLKDDIVARCKTSLMTPPYDYYENGNNQACDREGPNSIPLPYLTQVQFDNHKKSGESQLFVPFKTGNKIFIKNGKSFSFLGKATDLIKPLIVQIPATSEILVQKSKGSNYQTQYYKKSRLKSSETNDILLNDTGHNSPGIIVQSKIIKTNPTILIDVLFQFDTGLPSKPQINYYFSSDTGTVALSTLSNKKYLGRVEIYPQQIGFDGTGYFEIAFSDGNEYYTYVDKITIEGLVTDEQNLINNNYLFLTIDKSIILQEQIVMIHSIFGNPINSHTQRLIAVSDLYTIDIEHLDNFEKGTFLSISYDSYSILGIDENSIGLYIWNNADEIWEKIDSAVLNLYTHSVIGKTYKEGTFALFATKYNNDKILPAGIVDLDATALGNGRYLLSWTAPGDDVNDGKPLSYQIRYSDKFIDDSNWDMCIELPSKPASSAGNEETLKAETSDTIGTIYFAIKTIDDAGNISVLSNVVSSSNYLIQNIDALALNVEKNRHVVNSVFVGKDINATDNYDMMFDRYAFQPDSDVYIYSEINDKKKLEFDYRSGKDTSVYWNVKLTYVQNSNDTFNLSWDSTVIPDDGYYSIDGNDMKDITSLVFYSDTSFIVHFKASSDIYPVYTGTKKPAGIEGYRLKVFPNPAKETIYILCPEKIDGNYQIIIHSLTGKLLYKKSFSDGRETKSIVIHDLPSGIYIISISYENNILNQKIVIN